MPPPGPVRVHVPAPDFHVLPLSMERVSSRHPTTREMRVGMISLYLEGEDPEQIAQRFNVCKRTVERWIQRYERERTTANRPRSGRPRATTEDITFPVNTLYSIVCFCLIHFKWTVSTRFVRDNQVFCKAPCSIIEKTKHSNA